MSVNVRVEQKYVPANADRMRSVFNLLRALKREMNNAGIGPLMKRYEHYEKPCDLRRRKERQALLSRQLSSTVSGGMEAQQAGKGQKGKNTKKRVSKQARKTYGRG